MLLFFSFQTEVQWSTILWVLAVTYYKYVTIKISTLICRSTSNLASQSASLYESEDNTVKEDAIQSNDMTSMALSLLKQKLPPYVVNCILSSGFDEIEVLCSMDIDQKHAW